VIQEAIKEHGVRYSHATAIAPTGTISLSLANNASNGVEPSFSHEYFRNVIIPGKSTKQQEAVYSYEYLAYKTLIDPDATIDTLPDYFVTADDITPREHVLMQAACQKWIDTSISKTVNVPTNIPFQEFKDVYMLAVEKGLKGCTTFRFNPEVFQGVLVKEDDLENTVYSFVLEDGSTIDLAGNEEVEYEGDVTSAANLYDALKEGYYGKF
jgi:ribonucleoside-diphosphate reductase alpha chain